MMPRWILALVIPAFAAIVFWLVLPAAHRVNESSDFDRFYRPEAQQLLAGRGFTMPGGSPALRAPPGYALVVAGALGTGSVLGIPETAALNLLNLACIGLSSLFLYLIARDLWDGWLALLPSAAWSTYPLALWLTKQPNSEVPFTVLLFASAFVLWKLARRPAPSIALSLTTGALAGATMLVRPISLLLPLVLAALLWPLGAVWPRRGRVLAMALLISGSALVVAPWEIHASRAEGRFVLLSTAGAPAMRDGLTFGVNTDKSHRRGIYVPDAIRTVMLGFYSKYDELDSFGSIVRVGMYELGEHPVGTLGLVGMKLLRAWYGTDSQRLDGYILLLQVAYLTVVGWAAWLAWRAGGERRRLVIIVGSIVMCFWAMTLAALPLVRYLVPAIGMAFLLVPLIVERLKLRRV